MRGRTLIEESKRLQEDEVGAIAEGVSRGLSAVF